MIKVYKRKSDVRNIIGIDFITNVRISTESIQSILNKLNLECYCIELSPYSLSLYLQLNELIRDDKLYTIRVSNHYCSEYSNKMLLNIITSNGQFVINKLVEKEILEYKNKIDEENY